jgi:hypothetical protein
MAGGVLKLAGNLFRNKGLMRGIRNEALTSGAINAGANLFAGANPLTALAYGVSDTAISGAAQGAVRGIRGKPSRLELPANVMGSFASGIPVAAFDPRLRETINATSTGPSESQTTQIQQQNTQRMLLNNDLLAGRYMPGTMFQNMGFNNSKARVEQYLNDQGPTVNMAARGKEMAAIMGL